MKLTIFFLVCFATERVTLIEYVLHLECKAKKFIFWDQTNRPTFWATGPPVGGARPVPLFSLPNNANFLDDKIKIMNEVPTQPPAPAPQAPTSEHSYSWLWLLLVANIAAIVGGGIYLYSMSI